MAPRTYGTTCVELVVAAACFAGYVLGDRCANSSASYDFVIIGGGTAGLALATRLSQRLDDCILVIEAGPSALGEPKINIPGLKGSTIGTRYDWNFTTVPQPHALNRKFSHPRGKVLGGSQALNLMTWDRGSKADYDAWEELGNPGWNWNSMYEHMLRVETFTGINTSTYGSAGVGERGPVDTVINRVIPKQQNYWIPTLNKLGVPRNLDSLDGNPLGVMYQPSNINATDYVRSYTPNAYLPHARANLHVLDSTRVSKINFSKQFGQLTATGVTLEGNITITARKEVILSAGSIQSPGLLEISGVGQCKVLEAASVESLLDLAGVGENWQDHLRVQTSYQLKPNYTSFDRLRYDTVYATQQRALWNTSQVSEYDYTGSGYSFQTWQQALGNDSQLVRLAKQAVANSTSPVDLKKLSYLTTNLSTVVPQLEVIFSDGYTGTKGYPTNTSALYGENFFTLIAAVQHTLSRGSVHINSSSIDSPPVINPNYLAHEYDIQALVEALKNNRRIAETYPLCQAWVSEYEPGLDVVQTDAQWREYALNTTVTIYHPLGTCAMLPLQDGGVVDPQLKVYGTSNVRVVDASIIPVLISGHLQTAVLGIAEKAADIIVEEHRVQCWLPEGCT
ncbi:hypothetical protein LTR08_006122 [Meristemomyces frigidus]|nr:hypothetical protein LTR08_006122 [Meristemomyces frigidus]